MTGQQQDHYRVSIYISSTRDTCYYAVRSPHPLIQNLVMVDLMMATALLQRQRIFIIVLCLTAIVSVANAQQVPQSADQVDDVLRISSDIAQTDVMVFDKEGRTVTNLTRDQFELKIDGKTKPISFFEFLKAGTPNEDSQLAAARGDVRSPSTGQQPGPAIPLDRGRVVIFFVDDFHLAIDSVQRTRTLLEKFFERDFGQNDMAAISTGSGQLGFLEQLTNDKAILSAAVNRLRPQAMSVRDVERPPMSELQAQAVSRFDRDVTDFFVDRFLLDNPGFPRASATEMVRRRAVALLQQSSAVTKNSLQSLYNLMRHVGELPERKLLFFISDGFLIDDQTSNVSATLRRVTDAAARAGVVVYSIDARGLSTGIAEPGMDLGVDPTGRLARTSFNEVSATQAPLRSLAADTGGRALLNTNALSGAVTTALIETDAYYLLAWRPDSEQEANKFRRIEVSIVGHPEFVVRARRGFIERDAKPGASTKSNGSDRSSKSASKDDVLRDAIQSRFPLTALPTTLFTSFSNDKELGSVITISMEIDRGALTFTPTAGRQSALVDLAGIAFDDQGKPAASFKSQLTVNALATTNPSPQTRGAAFNHQTRLKPGIYQVRVAATDSRSGRSGSAVQWIEVPDLTLNKLTLSSLTLGERPVETNDAKADPSAPDNVFLSISRRFARTSSLRFLTTIYNATTGPEANAPPDVVLQVQIFRDNQPVMTTALSRVITEGLPDLKRLPYAADIPLNSIPAGSYRLQVTVIDRKAKSSATQHVSFEIG